jgi:hypothetical protein
MENKKRNISLIGGEDKIKIYYKANASPEHNRDYVKLQRKSNLLLRELDFHSIQDKIPRTETTKDDIGEKVEKERASVEKTNEYIRKLKSRLEITHTNKKECDEYIINPMIYFHEEIVNREGMTFKTVDLKEMRVIYPIDQGEERKDKYNKLLPLIDSSLKSGKRCVTCFKAIQGEVKGLDCSICHSGGKPTKKIIKKIESLEQ